MGGSGAFSFNKNKSKSKSEFGLNRDDRDLSFDTFFPEFQKLPGFISDFRSTPAPQLNLGLTGLTSSQEGMAQRLLAPALRQQTNLVSANNALRGQVSPLNFSNVVQGASERALTKVLPQFIDQAGRNELFNVTSPFETDKAKIEATLAMFDKLSQLFQGGSSRGKASGFGFAASGGGSATGGGGDTSAFTS